MNLEDAVGYIKNADNVSFVLGAGASVSGGIPLAGELIQRIERDFPHCLSDLNTKDRGDYGSVMGALAPGDRKALIQPLLDQSRVNWGHIALACVLKSSNVKRVLTFNFDLLAERAASLIGMHLPVYDFGVAPTKDIAELAAPAIFHLHGQSYGLRLMNARQETDQHKEFLRPLLADSLRNHLTVVIGYSGVADPALHIFEQEFNSNMNLIWLGYEAEPPEHLQVLLSKDYTHYVSSCDFDRTMISIANSLGAWPPEVVSNPPLHILGELEEVVEFPVYSDNEVDLLTWTRRQLSELSKVWDDSRTKEGKIQFALLAQRNSDADGVSENATDDEKTAASWLTLRRADEVAKRAEGTQDAEVRQHLIQQATDLYSEAYLLDHQRVEALNNWALLLSGEARLRDGKVSSELFKEAHDKYAKAATIDPQNSKTFFNWGTSLMDESDSLKKNRRSEKLNEAAEKLRIASNLGDGASYNLACVFALQGKTDDCFAELEGCLKENTIPSKAFVLQDEDLIEIRKDPRFDKLWRS